MRHILSSLLLLCLPVLPVAAQQPIEPNADIKQGLEQADSLISARQYTAAIELLAPLERATEHPVTPEDSTLNYNVRYYTCIAYYYGEDYEQAFLHAQSYRDKCIPGSAHHQSWTKNVLVLVKNYAFSLYYNKGAKLDSLTNWLEGLRREVGPDNEGPVVDLIASLCFREGSKLFQVYNFQQSYPLFQKAAAYYRLTNNLKEELKSISQVAVIERAREQRDLAEQYLLDIYGRVKASGDKLIYIDALDELATHYTKCHEQEKVWRCFVEADSLAEGETDPEFLIPYYIFKGKTATHFSLTQESVKWYEKTLPYLKDKSIKAARIKEASLYIRLCQNYRELGQWEQALHYARLDYDISFGEASRDYRYYLNTTLIYSQAGDSLRTTLAIDSLKSTLAPLDPELQYYALLPVGMAYKNIGNYQAALDTYVQLETAYPQKDADLLALRGGVEAYLERYDESVAHCKAFLDHLLRNPYNDRRAIAIARINLGNIYAFADSLDSATTYYCQGIDELKGIIREKLPHYSTVERDDFWNNVLPQFLNMTPFALKAELLHTDFTRRCYDALVLSKAFLLESDRTLAELVSRDGTPDDNRNLAEIVALQSRLNALRSQPDAPSDSILALSDRLIHLDRQLKTNCKAYGDLYSFMEIDFNQVRAALRPDEVLIDFTDYLSQSRGRCYAAYLVRPDDDLPRLYPLFRESQIDSMHVPYSHLYCEAPYSSQLIDLLWKPLAQQVPVGATVYYAPTQWLYEIAPENLQLEDGSLLGDHYRFVRISSARELVRRASAAPAPLLTDSGEAVLYGGLQYDLSVEDMLSQAQNYRIPPYLAMRGKPGGDEAFPPLPETRIEVDSITALLREGGMQATPYSDMHGTEESFLSLSGHAPRLLHLATHGFYYTPEEARNVDFLRGQTDAMSLSGLVMSGGNAAWRGVELPGGVLGGILTAAGIARMDLSGTEMVVLSACQTGLGKATSEGLFGLQRAFKKAGVQTLVMTLWEVSDVIARQFMVRFYENLAGRHGHFADKRAAFDAAKAYIRSRYSEAYAWAAFVMLD